MPSLLRISVTGTARIPRKAERAVLSIKVSSQGPSQKQTSSDAATSANKVQDMLIPQSHSDGSRPEQDAAAIAHWTMSSMTTHSWFEHNYHGEASKEQTHRTNLDFEVHVRDFDALGELAATLGAMEHVKIESVRWTLTRATIAAHKSELRKLAAADALQHAKDYADTFAMAIVKPIDLVEGGAGGEDQHLQATPTAFRNMGGGGGGEQEVTHVMFRPEEIDMAASVTCRFLVGNSEEELSEKVVMAAMCS